MGKRRSRKRWTRGSGLASRGASSSKPTAPLMAMVRRWALSMSACALETCSQCTLSLSCHSGRAGTDERQSAVVYRTLYSALCQIRSDLESGHVGRGLHAPAPATGTSTPMSNLVPRSFVPIVVAAGLDSDAANTGLSYRCVALESTAFVEHVLKVMILVSVVIQLSTTRVLKRVFHCCLCSCCTLCWRARCYRYRTITRCVRTTTAWQRV